MSVLVAQSCPTHCSPVDCGPPGSSFHRILQARIFPSPVDLLDPRIENGSPALQANSLPFELSGKSKICTDPKLVDQMILEVMSPWFMHSLCSLDLWSIRLHPLLVLLSLCGTYLANSWPQTDSTIPFLLLFLQAEGYFWRNPTIHILLLHLGLWYSSMILLLCSGCQLLPTFTVVVKTSMMCSEMPVQI